MARRVGSDGARTEAAIRDAALRLIARYGYEAISMRRLAQEVDLGAAALYRYFPNKQAILFGLLKRHMQELLEAWDMARLPDSADAASRLEAFTRFHIRHHLPRAEGVFLSYMELRSLEPENFAAVERMRRRYENDLTAILAAGVADGSLSMDDPRVAARAIIAMLTGITTWYRETGPLVPADIAEIYWHIVARMTGADGQAKQQPTTAEAIACS
jgi:AcrR family transcriptional regulator